MAPGLPVLTQLVLVQSEQRGLRLGQQKAGWPCVVLKPSGALACMVVLVPPVDPVAVLPSTQGCWCSLLLLPPLAPSLPGSGWVGGNKLSQAAVRYRCTDRTDEHDHESCL